jgi:2-polyprenyl-6-methoxyphenol hydroxylase-like FAD-dependent oxidoreductase
VKPRQALIVGAGIGGLAAGIALRKAGWAVRIHERSTSPRELGFALMLAPNAMAALDELGIGDRIRAEGAPATKFEVCHADGRVIRRFRAQPGGRLVVALRPVLHGALLAAVGAGTLVLGSEAAGSASGAGSATLRFAEGSSDEGDLIIGADGVASVIRRQLHPDEPPPAPSGYFALRGVAHGVAHQLGDLAGIGYLGDGVEAAAARASADTVYWYLSLLASDLTRGPLEPGAVLQRMSDGFDPRFRAITGRTEAADLRLDELFTRAPLRTWGAGRVTLLGDAAHPVLPHTGQGAAQALEDAVALGAALRDGSDIERTLRAYEQVRSPRTRRLIAMGPRIAAMTTTHSSFRKVLRTALIRYVPEPLLIKGAPGS